MTIRGLTPEGFVGYPLQEILSDIEEDCRADIHPQVDVSPSEILGQMNGIISRQLSLVWELGRVAFDARNPNNAEGQALDNLGSITGTERNGESKSQVVQSVTLTSGTSLIVGEDFVARTDRPDIRFTPREDYTAASDGTFEVVFESEFAGEVAAPGGSLEIIATPKAGWTATTNAEDAIIGSLVEEDSDFRIHRDNELAAPGSNTPDTLKADLLSIDGTGDHEELAKIISATVLENPTNATVDGIPASSFEAIVDDNDTDVAQQNLAIGNVIWKGRPTSGQPFGGVTVVVKDANGDDQTVKFSRVEGVNIYLKYVLEVGQNYVGDAAFKEAVSNAANASQDLGEDARYEVIKSFARDVLGVVDFSMTIGLATDPVGTSNLSITGRQRARFSVDRIQVTS